VTAVVLAAALLAGQSRINAPFVTTPADVVNGMLTLAQVSSRDVVYDLGSGDGRIVIAAAHRFGARGVGIDIDPERVAEATESAKQAGVVGRVRFRQADIFDADISDATVVTLYLLPELNLALRDKLRRELAPGARIVSHAFGMGDWKPDKVIKIREALVYLWTVPKRDSSSGSSH
jgi:SAM-dependent methyltransferase